MSDVFLVSGNAGQGKTTVAKNLAFALRQFGFDVLLVDADLRTPKLGFHVGMPFIDRTIQDVLLKLRKLNEAIYYSRSGVKLLLSGLSHVVVPHPSVLLPELEKLADIVIIDVPTLDSRWCESGCNILLVTQPDFPSVLDLQKWSKYKVHGIIVNRMHDDGIDLSGENIHKLLCKPILGVVPEEPRMREALKHGYSVVEFHPELNASCVLKQIAARLMNLEYQSPLKPSLLARFGL